MKLVEALGRISADIKRQRKVMTNEAATKQVSISPFIEALGYDLNNLFEVSPEYIADPSNKGNERVDFAILRDKNPILLIEAKSSNAVLSRKHWRQLHDYFNATSVHYGILTNGLEYRLYTDSVKANIMDEKPIVVIDLVNLDAEKVAVLEGFTKRGWDPENSVRKWLVRGLVTQELQQPSDTLVRYFAEQVQKRRATSADITAFRAIMQQCFAELTKQPLPLLPPPPPPPNGNKVPVIGKYRGEIFEGILIIDAGNPKKSRVKVDGEDYAVSRAALTSMQKRNPKLRSTNGWDWWYLTDPDTGEQRSISEIRKDENLLARLLQQK